MASARTVAVVVPSPATSEVLRRDLLHHLGAHVLVGVLELDLLGDGDAVLGDGRAAEGLLDDDVAAAGAEGDLDGARELAHAGADALAGVLVVDDLLGGHRVLCSLRWMRATLRRLLLALLGLGFGLLRAGPRLVVDDGEDLALVEDEVLLAVVLDVGAGVGTEEDAVAHLHAQGHASRRRRSTRPSPVATTRPSVGFSLAVSGSTIPPAVLSSASRRSTRTLSYRGLIFAIGGSPPPCGLALRAISWQPGSRRRVDSASAQRAPWASPTGRDPEGGPHHGLARRQGEHRSDTRPQRLEPEVRCAAPGHQHQPASCDRADPPPDLLARASAASRQSSRVAANDALLHPGQRLRAVVRDGGLVAQVPDPLGDPLPDGRDPASRSAQADQDGGMQRHG